MSKPLKVLLPPVFNGHDTSGPTVARPRNCEVGQPYWDENLNQLFVWCGCSWKLANEHLILSINGLAAAEVQRRVEEAGKLRPEEIGDVLPPAPETVVDVAGGDDADDDGSDDGSGSDILGDDDPTDLDSTGVIVDESQIIIAPELRV